MSNKLINLEGKIKVLENQIQKAKKVKQEIINTLQRLLSQLKERKITQEEYYEKLNKALQNKSAESWLKYYDNYIEICKIHIQNYEKQIKKEKRKNLAKIIFPIIISMLGIIIIIAIIIIPLLKSPVLLAPAGPASPGGVVELRAQTCAEQNQQLAQNSFPDSCEGIYPNSCSLSGDRLSCHESIEETATNSKSGTTTYGGVRIESYNSLITNCDTIDQVILHYKFWCSSPRCRANHYSCTIGVDADGGASFTNLNIGCFDSEISGQLSTNVTANEVWSCSNFFGPTGTRALAKAQALRTGGSGIATWSFDVLYFEVFYSDNIPPSITISSIGGDSISAYSISDNAPEILLTTNEIADCRASLSDESYTDMANDIDCTGDGTTSHTCQFISPISDNPSQEMHFACRDSAGNENSITNNVDTIVEIDTLPPAQSNWNPTKGSTIDTTSPTIMFDTNEIADCRASLSDESYTDMANDIDCTGDGTTSHGCSVSGLSPGPEIVYIACRDDTDVSPNEDTVATNEHVDYIVDINANPAIVSTDTTFSPVTLTAGATTDVTFTFVAEDLDGSTDLNDATATASFSKTGEATRSDPDGCTRILETLPNQRTYSCTITMQYFDDNGIWDITVNIQDLSAITGIGASTFAVNLLRDIDLSPTLINYGIVVQGAANILSPIITTVTNNGNFDTATDGTLTIAASNLIGETNPAENIPAANFKAAGSSIGASVCTDPGATALVEGISSSIPSINLPRGPPGSNTEEISYCLTLVPPAISSQFYSSTGANAWTINILAASLILTKRKKKTKKDILKILEKNFKRKYKISLEQLLILETRLETTYGISIKKLLYIARKKKEAEKIKEIKIPIEIFKQTTSPSESLCKYLKENKNLKFAEISKLINRDQRTIWLNYRNARKKKKEKIQIKDAKPELSIPINIFSNRKLSILESLIFYLREKQLKNIEIANLLNKDSRNIHTFYKRALNKLTNKK